MLSENENKMLSENENKEEERNKSIEDVEEELLKKWRLLCETNPAWYEAERLEISLGVKAELLSPNLKLILPELVSGKRRREDDLDLLGTFDIRRPLVKTRLTTNNVVLESVNDVLKPRKIESDWHLTRRTKEKKRDENNKKRKNKIVVANRNRRLEFGCKTTLI